jgi:hypothetical protein
MNGSDIHIPAEITEQAITEVQTQIGRVDTKASILFGLALAALVGGVSIAAKVQLHGLAVVGAAVTAGLIGVALLLLGAAVRPALGGNYGFVRWASAPSVRDLRVELHTVRAECGTGDVGQLWLLARTARRKYRRVRLAVDLLGAALAAAALTAVLSGLGW